MNSSMESKKRSPRCAACRTKLQMIYTCKCQKEFCVNHVGALDHACTFNYRADGLAQLSKQLDVSGLAVKLEKI